MTLDRQEHQGDAIAELQGLNIELLAGATAGTKIDLAAIRAKDTILKAMNSDGVSSALVDDTANFSITDIRASGTLTVAAGNGLLDGESFVVGDQTFTFVAGLTSVRKLVHSGGANVPIGATNTATAANIHEAINLVFGRDKVHGVVATIASNVVTVTARQEGTVGNAIVLTEAGTDLTASGAGTLAGGSDTGGVQSTTDNSTDTILLFWYQKQHELSPK
jgi:hypothetical protein